MNKYIKLICCLIIITLFSSLFTGCIAIRPIIKNPVSAQNGQIIESTTNTKSNIPVEYLSNLSANDMIALAAYKNVKDNSEENLYADAIFDSALENILQTNEDETKTDIEETEPDIEETKPNTYGKAVYPFDSIEIFNAIQFIISGDESVSFLEAACGVGDIIVIITEFMPYYTAAGGNLAPLLGGNEKAIIFIGTEGIYSCLLNGGGNGSNSAWDPLGIYDSYEDFSSHKTITDGAIQKDKSGTIMEFAAYRKNDTFTLKYHFVKGEDFEYTEPKTYNMVEGSLVEISVSTVYEIFVLHNIISEEKIFKETTVETTTE